MRSFFTRFFAHYIHKTIQTCRTYDRKTLAGYYMDNLHLGFYGIKLVKPYYKKIVDELYAKEYL